MRPPDEPLPETFEPLAARWRQFWIGIGLMLPWPVAAFVIQPLPSEVDFIIYFIGLFWDLLWDPIAAAQEALPGASSNIFTYGIVALFALMWLALAALPLLGRWPGRQVIGLWALQFSYAGAQAIAGYFYAKAQL